MPLRQTRHGGLVPTPTQRSAHAPATELADGWLQIVDPRDRDPKRDLHPDSPLELVLLDMDGTLTKGSCWEDLHHAFGVSNQTNWERYQHGELDDVEFMRSDIALWRVGKGQDIHLDELLPVLDAIPYLDGAREVVAGLRERGIATCILSGGIDMYVANGLRLTDTHHLQGDGILYVEVRDKASVARQVLHRLGVPKQRTASVGNSAYDVPMFQETGFGVAFNPSDNWVRKHARHVVEAPDMRPVLAHLLASGHMT